jgi:hypothetical protein
MSDWGSVEWSCHEANKERGNRTSKIGLTCNWPGRWA